jgi:hypothetical protein
LIEASSVQKEGYVSNKQVAKGFNSGFIGGGESAGGQEEVTKLTISMLLQHLRTLEPTLEAAIACYKPEGHEILE